MGYMDCMDEGCMVSGPWNSPGCMDEPAPRDRPPTQFNGRPGGNLSVLHYPVVGDRPARKWVRVKEKKIGNPEYKAG